MKQNALVFSMLDLTLLLDQKNQSQVIRVLISGSLRPLCVLGFVI